MDVKGAVAVRTQYLARPGRRVIVVTDLGSLRGPSRGTVELPLRLYWSGPSPVFDLGEPYLARWLYQIVLRKASRPEDLTGYLDRIIEDGEYRLQTGYLQHLPGGGTWPGKLELPAALPGLPVRGKQHINARRVAELHG